MNSVIIGIFTWILCIGLMFFCVYIISRYAGWFEKHSLKLLILSLILGLGLYFFGYYFRDSILFGGNSEGDFSLAELAASALLSFVSMSRMLVMELDIGELGVVGEIPLFRVLYGLVLLSAICFLATAVLSMLGGAILSRIRIFFLTRFGSRQRIYIIYGFRPEMSHFIEDIRKRHPRSQILIFFQKELEEGEKELVKEMINLGCIKGCVSEQPGKIKDFAIPERGTGNGIIFISSFPDTERNLQTITTLCGLLKKEKKNEIPIRIYGLVSYEICGEIPLQPRYDGFSVHWTDIDQLSVRQVFTAHPLTDSIPGNLFEEGCLNQKIEIAVLGYSEEAPYLYRSLLEEIQFKGVSFRLILIGQGISDQTADFRHMNPGISRLAEIECMDLPLMSDVFFEWLKLNGSRILRFYCMSEDDRMNVRLQRTLCASHITGENPEVYVLAHCRSPLWDETQAVYFGLSEQIFTEEMIIHEKLDRMAAAVHAFYQMYYGESEARAKESWNQTSVFNKESSHSLALHLSSKLYSIGYQLTEKAGTDDFQEYLESHPHVVENLAFGEHLRWEMFFFNRGWTPFSGRLPEGTNKDLKKKCHACLVSWEELKTVGERYGTNYQYLDEHFIRNMDKIAGLTGYGLMKKQNPDSQAEHR